MPSEASRVHVLPRFRHTLPPGGKDVGHIVYLQRLVTEKVTAPVEEAMAEGEEEDGVAGQRRRHCWFAS